MRRVRGCWRSARSGFFRRTGEGAYGGATWEVAGRWSSDWRPAFVRSGPEYATAPIPAGGERDGGGTSVARACDSGGRPRAGPPSADRGRAVARAPDTLPRTTDTVSPP